MRKINRINRELEGYLAPRRSLSMDIVVDVDETTVTYYSGEQEITKAQFDVLNAKKMHDKHNITVEYMD